MKPIVFAVISLVLLSTSCTVTKRHFRKGWHVEWKHALHTERNDVATEIPDIQYDLNSNPEVVPEPIAEPTQKTLPVMAPVSIITETPNRQIRQPKSNSYSKLQATVPTVERIQLNDEPDPDQKKLKKQERRSNFWDGVSSFLTILLILALIGLMIFALIAALQVSIGMFLLVLIPVILVAVFVGMLISIFNGIFDAAEEIYDAI